jgi:UDP-glucose 6-dehydrogenase
MTMLAINTPTVGGKIILDHLLGAIRTLAEGLKGSTRYQIVVVRSTVPPTTTSSGSARCWRRSRPGRRRHASASR